MYLCILRAEDKSLAASSVLIESRLLRDNKARRRSLSGSANDAVRRSEGMFTAGVPADLSGNLAGGPAATASSTPFCPAGGVATSRRGDFPRAQLHKHRGFNGATADFVKHLPEFTSITGRAGETPPPPPAPFSPHRYPSPFSSSSPSSSSSSSYPSSSSISPFTSSASSASPYHLLSNLL